MIKTLKSSISLCLIVVGLLVALISVSNCASIDSNDDLELLYENLAQYPIYKRNIDKYRYFGGIGKRSFDDYYSNEAIMNDDSFENLKEKTLDKMRFIDSIGKRQFKIEKQNLMKKSRAGQIDKYRYLGSIGK